MNGGNRTTTIISAVVAGSALLAATACGSADTRSSAARAVPVIMSPSGPPGGDPGQEPGGTASLEQAGAAARSAVKDSTLLSVQAQNNGQIWEVQLAGPDGTEHVVDMDAAGKAISPARVKDTGAWEKARVMAIVKAAKINFKEAVEKVSAAVPQGKITHLSLDMYDDKRLVWDADVITQNGTWHGIKVDARTGTVTKEGH